MDVAEQTWTYIYDNAHRMTQVNDPTGAETLITEYDSQGRAFRQWDGQGKKLVELTFNADGTTTVTDALEKSRIHTYDARGTLTKDSNQLGGTTDKTYDPNFRPSTVK